MQLTVSANVVKARIYSRLFQLRVKTFTGLIKYTDHYWQKNVPFDAFQKEGRNFCNAQLQ